MSEAISQEQNLIESGNAAEELLKTETFTKTINQLVDASFQTFCNSKAEEADARERAYHHYRGLVDIVNTLQQRVAVRDGINAKNDEQNSDNNGEE